MPLKRHGLSAFVNSFTAIAFETKEKEDSIPTQPKTTMLKHHYFFLCYFGIGDQFILGPARLSLSGGSNAFI